VTMDWVWALILTVVWNAALFGALVGTVLLVRVWRRPGGKDAGGA
jgi:hypothetical protein